MKKDDLHDTIHDCQYIVYVSSKFKRDVFSNKGLVAAALKEAAEGTSFYIEHVDVTSNLLAIHCAVSPSQSITRAAKAVLREAAASIGAPMTMFARSMLVVTRETAKKDMLLVDYLNELKRYNGDKKRMLS